MKKIFFVGGLFVMMLFVPTAYSASTDASSKNSYNGAIPRNVLETANNWMYANALPYARIRPTYTNLGKGIWEIVWTWQKATGEIYQSTLVIKNNGSMVNVPVITTLPAWPY